MRRRSSSTRRSRRQRRGRVDAKAASRFPGWSARSRVSSRIAVSGLDRNGREDPDRGRGAYRAVPAARDRPSQRRTLYRSGAQLASGRQRGGERSRRGLNDALFFGTSAFAVPSLRVARNERSCAGVVTQPDRPAGRGHRVAPRPVKAAAHELGLRVYEPERLRSFAAEIAGERSISSCWLRTGAFSRRRCSRCRAWVRSTCILRCCRNIAALRRFRRRCATGRRRPASASC